MEIEKPIITAAMDATVPEFCYLAEVGKSIPDGYTGDTRDWEGCTELTVKITLGEYRDNLLTIGRLMAENEALEERVSELRVELFSLRKGEQ